MKTLLIIHRIKFGLSLLLMSVSFATAGQNLNGTKIQVSPEALTYMKFNSEISNYEFGNDREDYATQVLGKGKDQIRIKTLNNKPLPTNLVINEGSRTHLFVIEVMSKIDINNFKAYYDYSDLKALKKLVANAGSTPPVAIVTDKKSEKKQDTKEDVSPKEQARAAKKAEKERKAQEEKELAAQKEKAQEEEAAKKEAAAREQQLQKDAADAKAEAERLKAQIARDKQLQKEKDLAAAKEQDRLKKEAAIAARQSEEEQKRLKAEQAKKDKDAIAAAARQRQLEKEQQQELVAAQKKAADEAKQEKAAAKEKAAREAQRTKDIAAAKEKDRQAATAKAEAQRKDEEQKELLLQQARREQKAKEDAIARQKEQQRETARKQAAAAEKERQRQEEADRKKQETARKAQEQQIEKIRQQQIALENEKAQREEQIRKAEAAKLLAEERAAALVKNPYWKTEWHKKYPAINFAEPPEGQMLTGEYAMRRDTAINGAAAQKALQEPARLKKLSEQSKGITVNLEGITFSGVNAFLKLRISNQSDKDFLVGKMVLSWWKKGGNSYYLFPCYVTEFPGIHAGGEATLIFGCRGVNATDADDFSISVANRLTQEEIQVPFTGKVYNKEMDRK